MHFNREKRKALGLQYKPNLEKEMSIQNDKTKDRKILSKIKLIDNTIIKNKVIKVNKRDEGIININMEGINATPKRYRIFKIILMLKIKIFLLKIKLQLILITLKKQLIVILKII